MPNFNMHILSSLVPTYILLMPNSTMPIPRCSHVHVLTPDTLSVVVKDIGRQWKFWLPGLAQLTAFSEPSHLDQCAYTEPNLLEPQWTDRGQLGLQTMGRWPVANGLWWAATWPPSPTAEVPCSWIRMSHYGCEASLMQTPLSGNRRTVTDCATFHDACFTTPTWVPRYWIPQN